MVPFSDLIGNSSFPLRAEEHCFEPIISFIFTHLVDIVVSWLAIGSTTKPYFWIANLFIGMRVKLLYLRRFDQIVLLANLLMLQGCSITG